MHLLCVFSCLWSKNVLKFRKKLVLKYYFVLLGPLSFVSPVDYDAMETDVDGAVSSE